jgi:hypothetical protein
MTPCAPGGREPQGANAARAHDSARMRRGKHRRTRPTIAIIHRVQQLRLDGAVNDPASGEAGPDMGPLHWSPCGPVRFNAPWVARRHGAGLIGPSCRGGTCIALLRGEVTVMSASYAQAVEAIHAGFTGADGTRSRVQTHPGLVGALPMWTKTLHQRGLPFADMSHRSSANEATTGSPEREGGSGCRDYLAGCSRRFAYVSAYVSIVVTRPASD